MWGFIALWALGLMLVLAFMRGAHVDDPAEFR